MLLLSRLLTRRVQRRVRVEEAVWLDVEVRRLGRHHRVVLDVRDVRDARACTRGRRPSRSRSRPETRTRSARLPPPPGRDSRRPRTARRPCISSPTTGAGRTAPGAVADTSGSSTARPCRSRRAGSRRLADRVRPRRALDRSSSARVAGFASRKPSVPSVVWWNRPRVRRRGRCRHAFSSTTRFEVPSTSKSIRKLKKCWCPGAAIFGVDDGPVLVALGRRADALVQRRTRRVHVDVDRAVHA